MASTIEKLVNAEVRPELKKFNLEIGKHYEGSFWINEFGEINVRPKQEGTKPNGMKKHSEGEQFVIYTSKNLIRIVFTFPKVETMQLKARFTQAVTGAMVKLFQYKWK